jgi:ribosomal protein S15P/S13E
MEMGSDEQLLSSGRIVAEYAASKARLANLMHEIVSVADTYSGVAEHIRKAHARDYANARGLDRLPQPDRVRELLGK